MHMHNEVGMHTRHTRTHSVMFYLLIYLLFIFHVHTIQYYVRPDVCCWRRSAAAAAHHSFVILLFYLLGYLSFQDIVHIHHPTSGE